MDNLHLAQLIATQAKKYGNKPALNFREDLSQSWSKKSWKTFSDEVMAISKALIELGINEQDKIGQFSDNKSENLVVDFALFGVRGIVVPIYGTSSLAQVEFIINNAQIPLLFVGNQQQYNIAYEAMENSLYLKQIIAFDGSIVFREHKKSMYYSDLLELGNKSTKHFEVQNRQNESSQADIAAILYTSGTTGSPKGAMLLHSTINAAIKAHFEGIKQVTGKDKSIAFLPLTHVFERMWCYFCIAKGITIFINHHPTDIQKTIRDVHPTLMCSVPRFWEKVYIGVNETTANYPTFLKKIVTWGIEIGRVYNLEHLRIGKTPHLLLQIKYQIVDKLIFAKLKHTLGIENAKMFPTAGAKLNDEITIFLRSIGIPIVYGYGLTETTATVAFFDPQHYEIGSVGTLLPGVQVRIGDDNEIQVKGETVFAGYYNNPQATKASFTEDGWYKTGDVGFLRKGHLYMTERIKDMFKTSNGKYIAPQEIETKLTRDPYIEQVAVIGDNRNFVTALICPSIEKIEKFAHEKNITYNDINELVKNPQVLQLIEDKINTTQKEMANYEKVKRFCLLSQPFGIKTGELTNTLKIKRSVINEKYKQEIDALYL